MAIPQWRTIARARTVTPARLASALNLITNLIEGPGLRTGERCAAIFAVVLSAALAGFFAGCAGPVSKEVCGLVLATQGPVEISGQPAGPFRPADVRSLLCARTVVRTPAGSSAQLACLPNALIHLSQQSVFEINSLTLTKDGNETDEEVQERAVRCRLVVGAIDFSHRGAEGVAEFILSTTHGDLNAKFNCVAHVVVDDRKIRITCASGMLTFSPARGGKPVTVEAGFVSEWPSQEPAVPIAAKTASEQQTLIGAFDAAQQLESLAKERGAMVPWKSR